MQLMVITREDAEKAGLKRYYTGIACVHGHVTERYVLTTRCVGCADARRKAYRKENPELVRSSRRAAYHLNSEGPRQRSREFAAKNPKKVKASVARWREKNREKVAVYESARKEQKNESNRRRRKERRANEPLIALASAARATVGAAFRRAGYRKDTATATLIGCSWQELKLHIEKQFAKGMTWQNRGSAWHVDHIVPLASAATAEELEALSHFTNLRPLWAAENHRKHAKRLHLI